MSNEMLQITGTAVWPHLTRPDTKWKDEGEFHTKLRITAEDAEPLLEQLEEMQQAEMAAVQKKKKGKRAKAADLPIQPEYDEDTGEETGAYILKAGMKASGKNKTTGKAWERKLPLFDGNGKPLSSKISIYSGSELALAFEARAWANPKAEVGVKLYLEAVQVIKLVSGSGASASKFGFGKVEGADEITPPTDDDEPNGEDDAGVDTSDEDDYDFD